MWWKCPHSAVLPSPTCSVGLLLLTVITRSTARLHGSSTTAAPHVNPISPNTNTNNDDAVLPTSSISTPNDRFLSLPQSLGGTQADPTDATIDLSFRHIGSDGVQDLFHYLSQRAIAPAEQPPAYGLERADGATGRTEEGEMEKTADHLFQRIRPLALSLRECALGDGGVAAVARSPWVVGPEGVVMLSLRNNQVTAAGVRALFGSLRACSEDRLSCLQLDFNPIGDGGVQPLPAYLKQRAAKGGGGLEELSLRFCDVGPAGCRYLSSALAKSAASASSARHTSSSRTGDDILFTSPAGEPLSEIGRGTDDATGGRSVQTTTTHDQKSEEEEYQVQQQQAGGENPPAAGIRRLLLTGNRLGDAGARALASALRKDRSLHVLDLTRCQIGDDGARCLADALRSNTCLRELRLGYNDISPEGASALASLLHAGPGTLETLELGGNRIGDAGAAALAQGLAGKAYQRQGRMGQGGVGLLRLGLAGNGIGCVGGCALAKALGGRSRGGRVALRELELAGNALTLASSTASKVSKNSSLYKSAGGALSSLLNQFVDESYYRGDSSPSSSTASHPGGTIESGTGQAVGGGGGGGGPLRCAVAALASTLRDGDGHGGECSLRVLGLGRTGMTDRDASRLARALRRRRVDSPLAVVEVGMNGLDSKMVEAIRIAVDAPTGPNDNLDNTPTKRRRHHRGGNVPIADDFDEEPPRMAQRRSRKSSISSASANRSGGSMRSRGSSDGLVEDGAWRVGVGKDEESAEDDNIDVDVDVDPDYWETESEEEEEERMGEVRGVMNRYTPAAGKVELEMFGRKVASFKQTNGTGNGMDVQVFGKRVHFDSRSSSSASSSSSSAFSQSQRRSAASGTTAGSTAAGSTAAGSTAAAAAAASRRSRVDNNESDAYDGSYDHHGQEGEGEEEDGDTSSSWETDPWAEGGSNTDDEGVAGTGHNSESSHGGGWDVGKSGEEEEVEEEEDVNFDESETGNGESVDHADGGVAGDRGDGVGYSHGDFNNDDDGGIGGGDSIGGISIGGGGGGIGDIGGKDLPNTVLTEGEKKDDEKEKAEEEEKETEEESETEECGVNSGNEHEDGGRDSAQKHSIGTKQRETRGRNTVGGTTSRPPFSSPSTIPHARQQLHNLDGGDHEGVGSWERGFAPETTIDSSNNLDDLLIEGGSSSWEAGFEPDDEADDSRATAKATALQLEEGEGKEYLPSATETPRRGAMRRRPEAKHAAVGAAEARAAEDCSDGEMSWSMEAHLSNVDEDSWEERKDEEAGEGGSWSDVVDDNDDSDDGETFQNVCGRGSGRRGRKWDGEGWECSGSGETSWDDDY